MMDATYAIVIKKTDDTFGATKFAGLTLDSAEELMEGIWQGTEPREDWAGLAVINEYNESIESELEW
jgi:hypothetical protein